MTDFYSLRKRSVMAVDTSVYKYDIDFDIETRMCQPPAPEEKAIPCSKCYGRGLKLRKDLSTLRLPKAMKAMKLAAVKKAKADDYYEGPKLCGRGRGQLLAKSANEYDLIVSSRRSSSDPPRSVGSRSSCPSPVGRPGTPQRDVDQPPSRRAEQREESSDKYGDRMSNLSTDAAEFRPPWLQKSPSRSNGNEFNIEVNISTKKNSGILMNNLDGVSNFVKQKGRLDETSALGHVDMESGFHVSSVVDNDYSQYFGVRRVNQKAFNLKEEEFPGLGEKPAPCEAKVQNNEKRSKPKKKVKLVNYNKTEKSSESTPASNQSGSKPAWQPASYAKMAHTKGPSHIMIEGLPTECTEVDVLNLLDPYGQVLNINLQRDSAGYSSAIVELDCADPEWVSECLSGAESLFHAWLMKPKSVYPLAQNPKLQVSLFIGMAPVILRESKSSHWIVSCSPYLEFQLRYLVDKDPTSNSAAIMLPAHVFEERYFKILCGEWDPYFGGAESLFKNLDFERLMQAAAFLQLRAFDIKPKFPGSVDIHNPTRFSAAYWCNYNAPAELNYKEFVPLFLYDMNFSFPTEVVTRKTFMQKMRSNMRSNIRFSTVWNPKWLSGRAEHQCPLTHVHEPESHLSGEELDKVITSFLVGYWKDHRHEFLMNYLHRFSCLRFPKGFGPVLIEHCCQYYDTKMSLRGSSEGLSQSS